MLIGAIADLAKGKIVYTYPIKENHVYYGYRDDAIVVFVWLPVSLWHFHQLRQMQGFVFCLSEEPFTEGKGFIGNVFLNQDRLELAYDKKNTYVTSAVVCNLCTPSLVQINRWERLRFWLSYWRFRLLPYQPAVDDSYMPELAQVQVNEM